MQELVSAVPTLMWIASIALLVWGLVKRSKRRVLYSVGIFVASVVLAGFLPRNPDAAQSVTSRLERGRLPAWEVESLCYLTAREKLVSPRSARQVSNRQHPAPVWVPEVGMYYWALQTESQNAFGVWLVTDWECLVTNDREVLVTAL